MRVRLLSQPDDELVGVRIAGLLRSPDTKRFWVASAWVRQPALRRLESELGAFTARVRRRESRGLFGVDLGGTTREGLETAARLFGSVRVFHSSGAPLRTFHPKLYLLEQSSTAAVVIGSSNLTTGGLWGNFEVGTLIELDHGDPTDVAFLREVRTWYDRWWQDPNGARPVNAATIADLEADAAIRLPSERDVRKVFGDSESRKRTANKPAFPDAVRGLKRIPKPPAGVASTAERDEQPTVVVPGLPLDEIDVPARQNDLRVLLAGVPHDRWKQVGFNRDVTEGFFHVYRSGDAVAVQGVTQLGQVLELRETRLILPETSNQNHRIELPEPDGRADPRPDYAILVVLERSFRTFRYMSVRPGDVGYSAIKSELGTRAGFGSSRKPETKRAMLTYGQLKRAWPGRCPITPD